MIEISFGEFTDNRGKLVAIERLPFEIKRVYFIYQGQGIRGGHRHKKCRQIVVCLQGDCIVHTNNGDEKDVIHVNNPVYGLLLEPEDWHQITHFSPDCILMVFASEYYDINDYIDEPY